MSETFFSPNAITPLCELEARELIENTIAGRKLKGWRNLAEADISAVEQTIIVMSYLATYHTEICELEINPLSVLKTGEGVYALDVRGSLISAGNEI